MNLNKIQQELNAPKSQKNTFGNYNYRSCEDILQAVKPLLGESVLTITDDIVLIGDRYYVKATATITSNDKSISVSGFAREPLDKKGMDLAQITGSTSSYARKYALNGLFAIDDTKDADTQDNTHVEPEKDWLNIDKNAKAWAACQAMYNKGVATVDIVKKMRTKYKVSKDVDAFIQQELNKGES